MFNAAQLAIIETGRFNVCYLIDIVFPDGNTIKWTTLPSDYGLYQHEEYLQSVSNLIKKSGMSNSTGSFSVVGNASMLAAFYGCQNSAITVQVGIYANIASIEFSTVFSGYITKYGIKRGSDSIIITCDVADKILNSGATNSRLLTIIDQQNRTPGDECLNFINDNTSPVFWGKQV